jgi:hypothetical protein
MRHTHIELLRRKKIEVLGRKKPGPIRGPVSVIVGVGADNIFQRGTSCAPAILGGYPPAQQHGGSMRSTPDRSNPDPA